MNAKMQLEIAEAALSPWRAWVYGAPMRRLWPEQTMDPDEACRFYGRNPTAKSLIWC